MIISYFIKKKKWKREKQIFVNKKQEKNVKKVYVNMKQCALGYHSPSSKAPLHSFLTISPPLRPLNQQTVQDPLPLLRNPPLYWFFVNSPLKVRFFSESYLLKVTTFLVKISQLEF